jgi:chemotaxis protein MotD
MMDIGISSAPSGADVAVAVKGGRGSKQSDDGNGGFLDALAGAGGNGGRRAGASAKDDTDTDAGATGDHDTQAGTTASQGQTDPASGGAASGKTDGTDPSLAGPANPPGVTKGIGQPAVPGFIVGTAVAQAGNSPSAASTATESGKAAPTHGAMPKDANAKDATAAPPQVDDIAAQLAAAVDGSQPAPADAGPKTAGSSVGKQGDTKKSTDTVSATNTGGAVTDALSMLNVPQVAQVAAAGAQSAAATLAAGAMQAEPSKTSPQPVEAVMQRGDADSAADTASALPETGDANASVQSFRLVRADGRGGALNFSALKTGDATSDGDTQARTPTGGAETVTVIDSRRYLGLAAGPNATVVAGALAGDREWAGAMQPGAALANAASWTSTGKVVNMLKIQLHPADLGEVTATMRLSGDQLSVDLKVQTGDAYRQLHADQSHMIDALRAQGYQVDNITVTLSSSADQHDSGRQSGFQGQPQQQSQANQGQGGDARPRGQNYSGRQADGKENGRMSGEQAAGDGAAGTSQRQRSGGVYL